MKQITRISKLRDYGVFQGFTWSSALPDFGRYNLIYGWNGTGKTTLSRLFRDLEFGQKPEMGEAVLRVDGVNVRGEEFPESDLQIRVFNRDFIQENVFPVKGGDIPSILILGAENVEKQKKVEGLKRQLVAAQTNLESARATKNAAHQVFDQFCIGSAGGIRDTLRSSGQNVYNNYNKSDFKEKAEEILKADDAGTHRLTDEEHEGFLSQHRATLKPKVSELTDALPDFQSIPESISQLLKTTVVSSVIDALKDDAQLAGWIQQGLALHRERSAERCQFCEQPMPRERLAALEGHFNDQYERFIQRLEGEIDKRKAESRALAEAERQLPPKADIYDDLGSAFESAQTELTGALKSAQGFLNDAVQALEDKKQRPFEHVELNLEAPPANGEAVQGLNEIIRAHNRACDDFDARVKEARNRLAAGMVAEKLDEFSRLKNAEAEAEKDVSMAEKEVQRLDAEISKLEGEISNHHRPAEELNEDISKYLGHRELCLEIKDTGYALTRRGESAESLSEGETTAIALLYFLKSLQDTQFTLADGVVVLDDPVSSLDANALFLAFGFIQERTKGAGQLFVLTHNFSFFRQVHNWFCYSSGRFFMLESVLANNARNNTIRCLDPLLEKYGSEYHYLFARVLRASTESASHGLEQNYVLPNMARRMLEAFLAFRLPQYSGGLWQQLKTVEFDEAKKFRILRFLNTHSHSAAVGEPEHDPTPLAEGPAVLKDLLEMIESMDRDHFSAMKELVASSGNSGETRQD